LPPRHQLTVLMAGRGGSDDITAQQQAMAAVDGIITSQASVLSFEHAFQIVAAVILIMAICIPFLRRPAPGAGPMH
jgi:uncharacterized membrane protein YgaE (UPF0421/DUF939 family)